jgi:hypothetical protein
VAHAAWLAVVWGLVGTTAAGAAPADAPAAAPWRYVALDVTVTIEPEAGALRIDGVGQIELLEAAGEVRLRINGDWQTLRFESLRLAGRPATLNLADSGHKAWRLAAAPLARAAAGTRLDVAFSLVKERDAFPLAAKRNVAVAISEAAWYPVPPAGEVVLPPGALTFRMPDGWHAAPMGTLTSSRREQGQAVEVFAMRANRRRAFIAAPYTVTASTSESGANAIYLLDAPVDAARLLAVFDGARRALEARYGPMPFRDYRIAEMPNDAVPWYGASEEGLIISRNEMMRSEEGLVGNMVHELAHAWWGNKVAPTGLGGPVINEGMASFTGMAFFEGREGRERAIAGSEFGSATGSPDATIYGYVSLWRAGKDAALATLKPGVGDHYNIAQTKGVWVLRMLRDRLGADRFDATLRRLAAERATLDVAGLREALLGAAPADRGLAPFLAQWFDQPGIPVLDVRWRNVTDGDRRRAAVSVFQRQAGAPYDLAVDLRLRTRKGILVRTVAVSGVDTLVDVGVADDVVGVDVDPEHKLLLWRPEFGEAPLASH